MKVIICGAGQVGFGIARQLVSERNSVTVVDQSPSLIANISETLDVKALVGHGSHPDVLDRAGAKEADMLIAVTFSDEVNMVAAQIAHSLFDVPLKVARVRAQSYLDPAWRDLFSRKHMPIDVIISPEIEVGKAVLARLANPGAFETVNFADQRVKLIGVYLDEDCPVVNTPLKQLSELFPDLEATVVGVTREGRTFVPQSGDEMLVGDRIYIVTPTEQVHRTIDIFGHEAARARRVILIGGGNIGLFVAQELERDPTVRVKIIEMAKDRAEFAADRLNRTVVLHGDGLNRDLLREAGVRETDVVVALTNDDETNILVSVIAKREGAGQALCLNNNGDYGQLMDMLGIDTAIDPRATTVSTILKHVRRGRIKGLHAIDSGAAEVIEAEALDTSPLVGKPLRDVDLPDGVIVGAVVRGDEVLRPAGDTRILAGDLVVIFAEREFVRKVEQLFRVSLEYF